MATNWNDTLTGTVGNDTIWGLGGNDLIIGGHGADTLHGGDGNDTIYAGLRDRSDKIFWNPAYYGQDPDSVMGGEGDDLIYGGSFRVNLVGGAGNDTIFSGADGVVSGFSGNDVIHAEGWERPGQETNGKNEIHAYGGDGNDTIHMYTDGDKGFHGQHVWGERGSDLFNFHLTGEGRQKIVGRIHDFDPTWDRLAIDGKVIDLNNLPANVKIVEYTNGAGQAQQFILIDNRILYALEGSRAISSEVPQIGDRHDELHFVNGWPKSSHLIEVRYTAPDNVIAKSIIDRLKPDSLNQIDASGASNSTITRGTAAADFIQAGRLDVLNADGGSGNDVIFGSEMGDTLLGGLGNDAIQASDGHDSIRGGDGDDTIYGGLDNDMIWGDGGNDLLYGGTENDTLHGGIGNDSLFGGRHDDHLYGNDGNDHLNGGSGHDTIDGGAGIDRILLTSNANISVNLRITMTQYTGEGHDTFINIENVTTGAGNDTITGSSGANDLVGWTGNDRIYGHEGNDSLHGGSGNDTLYGGSGNDLYNGGAGIDWACFTSNQNLTVRLHQTTAQNTGEGIDTFIDIENILGSVGHDTFYGSSAANHMRGAEADDRL